MAINDLLTVQDPTSAPDMGSARLADDASMQDLNALQTTSNMGEAKLADEESMRQVRIENERKRMKEVDLLSKVLPDTKGQTKEMAGIQTQANALIDPKLYSDMTVNWRATATILGKPLEELDATQYGEYKTQVAVALNRPAPKSEGEYRSMLSEYFVKEKGKDTALNELYGNVVLKAFQDTGMGKNRALVSLPTDYVKEWETKHKDLLDGDAGYHAQANRVYNQTLKDIESIRGKGAETFSALMDFTQGKADGDRLSQIAENLSSSTPEERQKVYNYIGLAAEAGHIDRGSLEQFAINMGQSFSRGFDFLDQGDLQSQENYVERIKQQLASGGVEVVGGKDGEPASFSNLRLKDETVEGQRVKESRIRLRGTSYREPSPDEVKSLTEYADQQLQKFQTIRELRNVAKSSVDPIRPVLEDSAMERGAYGLAGSLGIMVPVAINPALGMMAYQAQEFDRIMLENPGMNRNAAQGLALFEGAGNAALDRLQLRAINGKLPVFGGLLNGIKSNGIRRVLTTVGAEVLEQNLQEGAQDLIAPLTETMAAALREDMPDKDFGALMKDYVGTRAETFFAVLPLALIGGGIGTYRDLKNPALQFADARLQEAGFSPSQRDYISAAASPEERDARIQEEWGKRTEQDITAGKELIAARIAEAKSQKGGDTVEVGSRADGSSEWIVRDSAGKEVARVASEAEAATIIADRGEAEIKSQANVVADLLDSDWRKDKLPNFEAQFGGEVTPKQLLKDAEAKGDTKLVESIKASIEAHGNDPAEMAKLRVMGESWVTPYAEGQYKAFVKLNEGATAQDAFEELAHNIFDIDLAEGRITKDQAREWIRQAAAAGVANYKFGTDAEVRESMAQIAQDFAHNKLDQTNLPSSFVAFLKKLYTEFVEFMRRAKLLDQAFKDGKIDAEFERYLMGKIGLSDASMIEREVNRIEGEQGGKSFSIRDGESIDRSDAENQNQQKLTWDDENADTDQTSASLSRRITKAQIELGGGEIAIQPKRILELFSQRGDAPPSEYIETKLDSSQIQEEETRLFRWAKGENRIFDPSEQGYPKWEGTLNDGAEHFVFLTNDQDGNKFVIRVTKRGQYGLKGRGPIQYIKRIADFSSQVPSIGIEFLGIEPLKGGTDFSIWTRQPYVEGDHLSGDPDALLKEKGWVSIGNDYSYRHEATGVEVHDAHERNWIINNGKLYPIDVIFSKVPQQNAQASFSIRARDEAYDAAVKSGDEAEQQRLVDEAAREAGYGVKASHGSSARFNEFSHEFGGYATDAQSAKGAFFFSDGERTPKAYAVYASEEGPVKDLMRKADQAEAKGDWDAYEKYIQQAEDMVYGEQGSEATFKRRENATVYNTFLKGRFLEMDAEGMTPAELSQAKQFEEFDGSITAALKDAKAKGYDGVAIRNLDDAPNLTEISNHYAVFDPSNIKLSDPITRDDAGNVIPLSQRFNTESNDIRFSIRENPDLQEKTSELSEKDRERFFGSIKEFGKINQARGSAEFWNAYFKDRKINPDDVSQIEKQLAEWKAFYSPKGKKGDTSKKAEPKSPIQDVLDRYNDGDESVATPADVVNELDGLAGELDNQELEDAVREYRDARRDEMEMYGERGGSDDAAFESLVAIAQKIANEQTKSFSIQSQEQIDRVNKAVADTTQFAEGRMALYERAKERFKAVLAENKDILDALKEGGAAPEKIRRAKLIQAIAELEVILRQLPAEVRGQVGGFGVLARGGTGDTELANFFKKRLQIIDKELEKYLAKEYLEKIESTLQNAKPRKGANGVKKSTLGAVVQEFADKAYEASLLDNDATVARIESLEKQIAKADDPKKEADLVEEWAITNTFGALAEQSSSKLKAALDYLKKEIAGGRAARKAAEQARIDDIREKQGIISDALPGWTDAGLNKVNSPGWWASTLDLARQAVWSHASFEQILRRVLPPEAQSIVEEWSDRIRRANNKTEAAAMKNWQNIVKAIQNGAGGKGFMKTADALAELGEKSDGKVFKLEGRQVELESIPIDKAEQLVRGEMNRGDYTKADIQQMEDALIALPIESRKQYISIYRVIEEGRTESIPMTLDEMIFTTMAWDQSDVRVKMENSGWTQESYDQMVKEIASSKVATAVRDYLKDFYRNSTKEINPVYSRMFGMSLPDNPDYAPTSYESRNASGEMSPDGSPTQNTTTPGFAKARVTHNEAFKITPATQIFQQRSAEQAQWVAFAELHREMSAVLNGKNVRLSMKQENGKRLSELLSQILDNIAKGGGMNADAAYIKSIIGAATSGTAVASMGYNLKTIFNQFDSVTRFLYAMPLKDVMRAITNPQKVLESVPAAWHSETVQNRVLEGSNPAARFALKQAGMTPSKFLSAWYGVGAAGLKPMQYADGALTSLSSAMVYSDAHAKALKAGLSEKDAEARALDAMDAAIWRFSQPVMFSAKSPVENNAGATMKLLYMFASDARLKTGILIDAVQSIKDGKGSKADHFRRIGVVFLGALLAQTVSNIYRDIFSDDDDDEIWTAGGYAKALALAPFQGFFLLGTAIDVALSSMTGQRAYTNSSNPLVNAGSNAITAAKHSSDILQTDDMEAFYKELGRIARAISLTPVTAVPAAVLNPVKPIVGAKKNIDKGSD